MPRETFARLGLTASHLNSAILLLATILALSSQRYLHGQRFDIVLPHSYSIADDAPLRPFDGPKPLIVSLWDHIANDTVIGGSTPDVVLYEDGKLIYRKFGDGHPLYEFQQLGEDELGALKRRLARVLELNNLGPRYDITPNQTSRPRTCFLFDDGDRRVLTQVRGLYTPQIQPPPPEEAIHEVSNERLPAELIDAHRFLCSLRKRHGREWAPRCVEVLLWPHRRDVLGDIAAWPPTWPGLESDMTVTVRDALGDREMYAIFLPGDRLRDVERLLTGDIDAIELGGRQWQFAVRHVFPSEHRWRIPFNEPLVKALQKKDDG